jgi:GcrA cell cycle regulator
MSEDFLTPTSGEVLYREMVAPTIYVPRYQNWFTPEQDAELRRLWAENLTTKAIAKLMGRSKNSIIGRAHRLHLEGRASPIIRDGRPPRIEGKRAAQRERLAAAMAQEGETLNQAPDLHALNELKQTTPPEPVATDNRPCQYILGDPRVDKSMCGQPTKVHSAYCPRHHALCWTTPPQRKIDGNQIHNLPLCKPRPRFDGK